jgi:hypothetical protein
MGRKQRKAKPTPWNIGQPLTFPVIRPRIQRIANQTVDEAMRGPFQGKAVETEEVIPGATSR